jgi:hypothetical protein
VIRQLARASFIKAKQFFHAIESAAKKIFLNLATT